MNCRFDFVYHMQKQLVVIGYFTLELVQTKNEFMIKQFEEVIDLSQRQEILRVVDCVVIGQKASNAFRIFSHKQCYEELELLNWVIKLSVQEYDLSVKL